MTCGCSWTTDAGQSGVTGPVSAAATASALAPPVASSTRCRASRIGAEPLGERVRRHGLVAEGPRVVPPGRLAESHHPAAGVQRRPGLVEGQVPVAADPEQLQVDAAQLRDPQLELLAAPPRHDDLLRRDPQRARRSRARRTPRTTPGARPAARRTRPTPPDARRRSPRSPGPAPDRPEGGWHPSRHRARAPDPAQQSGERAPRRVRRRPPHRRTRPRPCTPSSGVPALRCELASLEGSAEPEPLCQYLPPIGKFPIYWWDDDTRGSGSGARTCCGAARPGAGGPGIRPRHRPAYGPSCGSTSRAGCRARPRQRC